MQEHYVDADTQVAEEQGVTWMNFALNAQCKQRPAGTRTSSRTGLPSLAELKEKANIVIQQRQAKEQEAAQGSESEDEEWGGLISSEVSSQQVDKAK